MEPNDFSHIGLRLRHLRKHIGPKKIIQKTFGEWMGVKMRVYQSYEFGNATPGADKVRNLLIKLRSEFPELRVDADWVLTGAGEPYQRTLAGLLDRYAVNPAVIVRDQRIVEVGTAVEELTGYTRAELLDQDSTSFLTLDSRVDVENNVENGTEPPYLATIRKKDSARLPVLAQGKSIDLDGESVRLIELRPVDQAEVETSELVRLLISDTDGRNLVLDYLRGRKAARRLGEGLVA